MPTLAVEHGQQLFYTIDDHTTPWRAAQTIVFVHGFTENTEAWRSWVPHFSRDYQVVRFDQRGFGQSSPVEDDFTFTTELLGRDLARLIDTVSPHAPVHLVSGKSGGIAAMQMALSHPLRVRTLTFVSPAIKGPQTPGWIDHMDQHGVASWARWTMGERLGSSMPPAGVDWWVNMMGGTALSTAHAYLRWVAAVDMHPRLPEIACPTLIVGNESKRRGIEEFKRYQAQIPNAELTVIEVDGYHTSAVAPDQCAAAVRTFIAKYPA